ncbi:hypothetical protein J7E79_28000 [Bacillus sp. ISL-40]|uniref:hypothetical protein n=1 Tax=unclassified Bacillus (in: firmicutes) TaxID=185979 RepID=UPI001BEA5EF2|nr:MULTISPECIES: hypothetical protein [unclassified Bacillus (in: firmicutes)]MBT2701132.1 hypothetical protein [Bacillus sp. ISL-40]MBT2739107.1 hypothetical protein [Bacillus sp. ISL-77]
MCVITRYLSLSNRLPFAFTIMIEKLLFRKDVFFIATLRTGPFLIPIFTHHPPNPCNIVIVTLSNQTNRTLTATVRIDQVILLPSPTAPPAPILVLLPPSSFTLPPNTAAGVAVPVFTPIPITDTTVTAAGDPRALIVTVSGDVEESGDEILVSVTGGFSSDGSSLDESEPTMFFRHEDFVVVHRHHHRHDESSD